MEIQIRMRGMSFDGGLETYVTRRVWSALARFRARLTRVWVQLADVNGPRGERVRRLMMQVSPAGTVR